MEDQRTQLEAEIESQNTKGKDDKKALMTNMTKVNCHIVLSPPHCHLATTTTLSPHHYHHVVS